VKASRFTFKAGVTDALDEVVDMFVCCYWFPLMLSDIEPFLLNCGISRFNTT